MGRFIQLTNEMSTFGQAETNEFPSHLYAYRYFSQNPYPDWVNRVSARVIPGPSGESNKPISLQGKWFQQVLGGHVAQSGPVFFAFCLAPRAPRYQDASHVDNG
jgi:hypothetical protein